MYLTLEEPSLGTERVRSVFSKVRAILDGSSQIFPSLDTYRSARRCLLLMRSDCPSAVGALKYFCDEAPEYHAACAGSLLGVRLSRETSAFPVGKVEFMEMRPMSFPSF